MAADQYPVATTSRPTGREGPIASRPAADGSQGVWYATDVPGSPMSVDVAGTWRAAIDTINTPVQMARVQDTIDYNGTALTAGAVTFDFATGVHSRISRRLATGTHDVTINLPSLPSTGFATVYQLLLGSTANPVVNLTILVNNVAPTVHWSGGDNPTGLAIAANTVRAIMLDQVTNTTTAARVLASYSDYI